MGVYTTLPDEIQEVDVIIGGGGTAGCILAGRLAAADPKLRILVIEAGRDNYENHFVRIPAMFLHNQDPLAQTAIFYQGNKAEQLAGRRPVVPSGGVLGGGSSINFMVYTRAQRWDYDAWKTPGWSTDELIPFLKKLETYHEPDGTKGVHGTDGPIHVSRGPFAGGQVEREFINAATAMGIKRVPDLQDLDVNEAVSGWPKTIGPDGKRQDAAHAYLQPLLRGPGGVPPNPAYPNLHVLTETLVERVVVEADTAGSDPVARAVELVPNPAFQPGSEGAPARRVRASRLVIVSAGALGTPLVLQRSGLGPAAVLAAAGVPLVADLPGVGADYQDHHCMFWPYRADLPEEETIDALIWGSPDDVRAAAAAGDPRAGWNGLDAVAKVRPTEAEVDSMGPRFREAWDRDFRDEPNRPMMFIAGGAAYLGNATADHSTGKFMTAGTYTAYPYSRGQINITGRGAAAVPSFDVGFLSDPDGLDVAQLVWAYKKQRALMRRTASYRGEFEHGHPRFPAGSAAACGPSLGGPLPDIVYSAADDAAIEAFLREHVETTWHSLGTAKMAPRDARGAAAGKGGVVDPALSVHGVRALKVVDMSIVPVNVAANTCNTAMVIGEKAADIIMRELGII